MTRPSLLNRSRGSTSTLNQPRVARDLSEILFESRTHTQEVTSYERRVVRDRARAVKDLLATLHRAGVAQRLELLLFEELDVDTLRHEMLIEPAPPPGVERLDLFLAKPGRPACDAEASLELVLHLCRTVLELNLQGVPSHLLLRPTCLYVAGLQGGRDGVRVVLADVGLSILIPHFARNQDLVQGELLPYAAPELLGEHYFRRGDLADMHAIGHIAAACLLPDVAAEYTKLTDPRDKFVLPPPDFYHTKLPPGIAQILTQMAHPDPRQRPASLMCAYSQLLDACRRQGFAGRVVRGQPASDSHNVVELRVIQEVTTVLTTSHDVLSALVVKLREIFAVSLQSADPLVTAVLDALELMMESVMPPEAIAAVLPRWRRNPPLPLVAQQLVHALPGPAEQPLVQEVYSLAIAGLAMVHLQGGEPSRAIELVHQVYGLWETGDGLRFEIEAAVLLVETEAALMSGEERRLRWVASSLRELKQRLQKGKLDFASYWSDIVTLIQGLMEISLGNARTALSLLQRVKVDPDAPRLVHHMVGKLRLLLAMSEVGWELELSPSYPKEILMRYTAAAAGDAEHANRLVPCFERPQALLLRLSQKKAPLFSRERLQRLWRGVVRTLIKAADRFGEPRRATVAQRWYRIIRSGIFWHQRAWFGFAARRYQQALALLPMDGVLQGRIDLYLWLAQISGEPYEERVAEFQARAAEWLDRLPYQPGALSIGLWEGRRHLQSYKPPIERPRPAQAKTLTDVLDTEVTAGFESLARWIAQQFMEEFGAMRVSLSLTGFGDVISSYRAVPLSSELQQSAGSYLRALQQCGCFEEMAPSERIDVEESVRKEHARSPDGAYLGLTACTVERDRLHEEEDYLALLEDLAAAAADLLTLQEIEVSLRQEAEEKRILCIGFSANGSYFQVEAPFSRGRLPEQLLDCVNRALADAGTKRRFDTLATPSDREFISLVLLTQEAVLRCEEAGLLPRRARFEVAYAPRDFSSQQAFHVRPAVAQPKRRRALWPSAQMEEQFQGSLSCRAQVRGGLNVHLEIQSEPFRTFSREDRRLVKQRLAELVPAFMVVKDWALTTPMPTQREAIHHVTHEAKRPLLWTRRLLAQLLKDAQISRGVYDKIDNLLSLCIERMALFCNAKVWEMRLVDLPQSLRRMAAVFRDALQLSGHHSRLFETDLDAMERNPAARRLRVRYETLELILSELLWNAWKYSKAGGRISLIASLEPLPSNQFLVRVIVENEIQRTDHPEEEGEELMDHFSSTGLGMRLVIDLVKQLPAGTLVAQPVIEAEASLYRICLAFTAEAQQ